MIIVLESPLRKLADLVRQDATGKIRSKQEGWLNFESADLISRSPCVGHFREELWQIEQHTFDIEPGFEVGLYLAQLGEMISKLRSYDHLLLSNFLYRWVLRYLDPLGQDLAPRLIGNWFKPDLVYVIDIDAKHATRVQSDRDFIEHNEDRLLFATITSRPKPLLGVEQVAMLDGNQHSISEIGAFIAEQILNG